MCWNAEVSLNTFLSSLILSFIIYLIKPYDIFTIVFILSFAIIQLLEYFIWTYINNKKYLRFFGFLTFVVIFFQPILLLYVSNNMTLLKNYIILQTIWFGIYIFVFNLKFSFLPYVAKNKHLSWNWTDNNNYIAGFMIIYSVFYLWSIYKYTNIYIFILAIITLAYSIYNYKKYKTISSMWCWSANIMIFLALFRALYIRYYNL